MKRLFLLLSMIACLCLSGVCSVMTVDASSVAPYTEDQYASAALGYFQSLVALDDATLEQYITSGSLDDVSVAIFQSWKEQRAILGEFVEVVNSQVTIEDDQVTVVITAQYANDQGDFTMMISPDMMTLYSASFDQVNTLTLGDIFEKAALNTVMGMGTVFAVLIFIAYVISLFKYIPNVLAAFSKKKELPKEEPPAEEEEEEEEELADDQELVAVIMAAIYASMEEEGKSLSKDGLIVRSIRKARKR